MTSFRYHIDPGSPGFADLELPLDRIEHRAGLMRKLDEALLAVTQDRFASQTTPDGAAWAPLRPSTVARRGSSSPILRVSGRLYGSLCHQVEGDGLRIGPNTIYSAVHNFGHTWPTGRTVPARQYVGFGPADERAARETIEDWLGAPP